jgi:hypothetical protein
MPTDFGLILPPWNFATTAGNLLDRVVGEVGIDFLTVPVVTGESQQFRLASGFATPYFFTEGGWHFQPELSLYKACGLRPPVACWCGKRDTLGPIQEYAERHGLKLSSPCIWQAWKESQVNSRVCVRATPGGTS